MLFFSHTMVSWSINKSFSGYASSFIFLSHFFWTCKVTQTCLFIALLWEFLFRCNISKCLEWNDGSLPPISYHQYWFNLTCRNILTEVYSHFFAMVEKTKLKIDLLKSRTFNRNSLLSSFFMICGENFDIYHMTQSKNISDFEPKIEKQDRHPQIQIKQ